MKTQTCTDPHFPHSLKTYQTLHFFAERMESLAILKDGMLTARVIGEFSAGKTRLLRELLSEMIPPELFPVSSLERQTRLPLEITHGDTAMLTLIERKEDYDQAITLKTLTHFPERDELADYNPLKHRLRLALPESHFVLASGDHYSDEDNSPKRLFLIDTPGWNSGDDQLAESGATDILAGYHNLALVFVTDANRLDGAKNSERLREFLKALEAAEFLNDPNLIFVVTRCPDEDKSRLEKRARELVLDLWKELDFDPDKLLLNVICVDFNALTDGELQDFRAHFWKCLLAPLEQKELSVDPWISRIRSWPKEWDLRPDLLKAHNMLARVRQLLELACKEGEFLHGMNKHRVAGLDKDGIQIKTHDMWLRQLKCTEGERTEFAKDIVGLAPEHPLANWWKNYWLDNIKKTLAPIEAFFTLANHAINRLSPDIEDWQAHLKSQLETAHKEAQTALDSSFARLVETAQKLTDEALPERAIATLITLSLLQARYADYYDIHAAALPKIVKTS